MGAILKRVDDDRSPLKKARRLELVRFAHANGQMDITEMMPADIIRAELTKRGLTNIKIPHRLLGARVQEKTYAKGVPPSVSAQIPQAQGIEADADADLMRQWLIQQRATKPQIVEAKPVQLMDIRELRRECTRRGIKMARTDNLKILRDKLNGTHTA